jgi:precorrin-6B methylase 2
MDYLYFLLPIICLIWSSWLWRYCIKSYLEKKRLRAALSTHPKHEQYLLTERFIKEVYGHTGSRRISMRERLRLGLQGDDFTYGEIECLSFMNILDKVRPQSGEIFCDLGCGAGKALIIAALNHPLSQVIGVELLPGLCLLAHEQIEKALSILQAKSKRFANINQDQLSNIRIIQQDFTQFDVTSCHILFINATCLNESTWCKLLKKLNQLNPGCRVIVTSRTLSSPSFQLLDESTQLMSWGLNSVYIYQKR